ncbi:hypothetical protein FACS1894152_7960 [Bacilli bacterium]|nr:hypothetical protein FACS1894152_7960 [Bacilli bacterium]
MCEWLDKHGFSYKKPKQVPMKLDEEKQKVFVEEYKKLVETTPDSEPILFLDAVHPTMATKVTYGWLKKGDDNLTIATTASKTRLNVVGAINLKTMEVEAKSFDKVNSDAMTEYFEFLKEKYTDIKKLHIILDNGSYNISKKTREEAEKQSIVLHFLPPQSPNLGLVKK